MSANLSTIAKRSNGMGRAAYVQSGAQISPCGRYRYHLWREWIQAGALFDTDRYDEATDGAGAPLADPVTCVFVMLNPSTADGKMDDPTIRRCVGFAKLWGYCRVEVLNLFAYRTPSPAVLLALNDSDDPIGPENRGTFQAVLRNQSIGRVVCAWGADGNHLDQGRTAYGWLIRNVAAKAIVCLGRTKDGSPRHPLYVASAAMPVRFEP